MPFLTILNNILRYTFYIFSIINKFILTFYINGLWILKTKKIGILSVYFKTVYEIDDVNKKKNYINV